MKLSGDWGPVKYCSHIAKIFAENNRNCSACGAIHAYADGISDMQVSETMQSFI